MSIGGALAFQARMFRSAPQQQFAIVAMLVLLALPSPAAAQAEAVPPPTTDSAATFRWIPGSTGGSQIFRGDGLSFSVTETTHRTSVLQDVRKRDSLANGILIGAAIGAAALGTFGAIVCKAMQQPDEPSCVDDTLRLAAIGGAIGAGGGLVIDAARSRQSGVRVSLAVRF